MARSRDEWLVKEVLTMKGEGAMNTHIAETLGVSAGTVQDILKERRGSDEEAVQLTDDQIDALITMYKDESTAESAVALHFKLTIGQMYEYLTARGVPTRRQLRDQQRAMRDEMAVGMYVDGAKLKTILAQTGIARQRIYDLLEKRNIPTRRE